MLAAISQPTFIPYAGYFSLINKVNKFIILDNVQFDKRSWQQRNFLLVNNQPKLITIPVISKGRFHQNINEVLIDYNNLKIDKLFKTIETNYKKEIFFELFFFHLKDIFNKKYKFLYELNVDLIKTICSFLDIKTEIFFSSNFKNENNFKKTELLESLLKEIKCTQYITTVGSKKYLGNLNFFPKTNIKISYYKFENINKLIIKNYKNKPTFLSIVDLIFKYGKDTKQLLNDNFEIID